MRTGSLIFNKQNINKCNPTSSIWICGLKITNHQLWLIGLTEKNLTENDSGVKSFQKGDVTPVKENLIDIAESKMSGRFIYFITLLKNED